MKGQVSIPLDRYFGKWLSTCVGRSLAALLSKHVINVPIVHCFPSINQEYLWEAVGNYIVSKGALMRLSIIDESVLSEKVIKEPGGKT
jgi:hypothetical protein